jgi:DNA-binding response OmpR family regulator
MKRILIIDEDKDMRSQLGSYLPPEGYEVEIANNGESVSGRLSIGGYVEDIDLIVIDIEPYRGNGFDSLRQLRNHTAIPIVALIDGGNDVDRIVGLELGADDCLSKPFNPRELLARVHAVLRRVEPNALSVLSTQNVEHARGPRKLRIGDVEMNLGARTVNRSGEKVDLTSVEFNLLECFLRKPGELISRETLNEKVLGRSLIPYDRSIDVHVSKLRKKLGNVIETSERIKAIRGEGYLYSITDDYFSD